MSWGGLAARRLPCGGRGARGVCTHHIPFPPLTQHVVQHHVAGGLPSSGRCSWGCCTARRQLQNQLQVLEAGGGNLPLLSGVPARMVQGGGRCVFVCVGARRYVLAAHVQGGRPARVGNTCPPLTCTSVRPFPPIPSPSHPPSSLVRPLHQARPPPSSHLYALCLRCAPPPPLPPLPSLVCPLPQVRPPPLLVCPLPQVCQHMVDHKRREVGQLLPPTASSALSTRHPSPAQGGPASSYAPPAAAAPPC